MRKTKTGIDHHPDHWTLPLKIVPKERVRNVYSVHDDAQPEKCGEQHGVWRTILCDRADDRDVVECHLCGEQREVSCHFDEDFA